MNHTIRKKQQQRAVKVSANLVIYMFTLQVTSMFQATDLWHYIAYVVPKEKKFSNWILKILINVPMVTTPTHIHMPLASIFSRKGSSIIAKSNKSKSMEYVKVSIHELPNHSMEWYVHSRSTNQQNPGFQFLRITDWIDSLISTVYSDPIVFNLPWVKSSIHLKRLVLLSIIHSPPF